ncbi:MAG: NADH-quinone oxidoreductase subunit J [Candidatus Hermodarchaeota archaeon]
MQEFELLFEQFEFLLLAGIVIVLAYLALEHREIVYAAFFFGIMASFVAGFFLLLEAPFIAGMQIAVYTGGISALVIFGVLLLPRAQDSTLETFATPRAKRIGMIFSFSIIFFSALLAAMFPWSESFPVSRVGESQDLSMLAEWLWGDHGIYVQMIALILFTALVGAIALMKMDKAELLGSIKGEFGPEAMPQPEESATKPDEPMEAEEPEEEVAEE